MLFFDSYAIIEILKGNPTYHLYEHEVVTTSVLNLGEVYYALLKDQGQEKADAWFEDVRPNLLEIDPKTIREAMLFKYKHTKKKLSMVDCAGYILARKMRILFLTGDKAFEGLPNVTFIRK